MFLENVQPETILKSMLLTHFTFILSKLQPNFKCVVS